jgi:phosphopantothenoylcysteine synthetase/decarboxylase
MARCRRERVERGVRVRCVQEERAARVWSPVSLQEAGNNKVFLHNSKSVHLQSIYTSIIKYVNNSFIYRK